jgi:hypothetical protein
MTRIARFCLAGLAMGLLLVSNRASGDVVNGSFEVGMSDWTTVGPNSAVPDGTINGFNATDGHLYAYLNTGAGAQSVLVQDFVLNNCCRAIFWLHRQCLPERDGRRNLVSAIHIGSKQRHFAF